MAFSQGFKRTMRWLASILIVLLALFILLELPSPFKVTDPSDTRFEPLRYKFSDYDDAGEWAVVLKAIFKPGDDRAYVERILVESAGARAHENDKGFLSYSRRVMAYSPNIYGILAVYDDNNKLIAMDTTRGPVFNRERVRQAIQLSIVHERERKGIEP